MNSRFLSISDLKKINFKKIGSDIKISKNVTIIGSKNISIGSNVRIDDYTIISAQEGTLEIGSNVHLGGQSYFGCAGSIQIGSNINISQGVKLYSKLDNYLEHIAGELPLLRKIIIEDNVIIGSGTVIIGKSTIGEGATIGALSFVKNDLNNWSVYAGNPLKFIRVRKKK